MVNKEHKLTVDDLIVEYMIYKVNSGYKPEFFGLEFIDFLRFFENKIEVEDTLYDVEALFKRFLERKVQIDWGITDCITNKRKAVPHMDIEYNEEYGDYVIKANYRLSDYDKSVINTYFMDNKTNKYYNREGSVFKIRNAIKEYLSNQPKRTIDDKTEVDKNEILIGKYLSAEIITQIWNSYIDEHIKKQMWPTQCTDINKYLFEVDLSQIIGLKSIKKDLIEIYNVFSKRIAVLYHNDKNLKISSRANRYLAKANYDLLIQDYERMMNIVFRGEHKSLEADLSLLTFKESRKIGGVYDWYDDPDIKVTTTPIENDNVKKLVRKIEKTC